MTKIISEQIENNDILTKMYRAVIKNLILMINPTFTLSHSNSEITYSQNHPSAIRTKKKIYPTQYINIIISLKTPL